MRNKQQKDEDVYKEKTKGISIKDCKTIIVMDNQESKIGNIHSNRQRIRKEKQKQSCHFISNYGNSAKMEEKLKAE